MMRITLRLVYSLRKTNSVANAQHTTLAIIMRYPIESGCSKFGSMPGGGGITPEISWNSGEIIGPRGHQVQDIHRMCTYSHHCGVSRGTPRSLNFCAAFATAEQADSCQQRRPNADPDARYGVVVSEKNKIGIK
jgi:hypothetical protein